MSRRPTATCRRSRRPCTSSAPATWRRWTRRAPTALTSTSAARPRSQAISAGSASPTTTRCNGSTSSSTTTPNTACARSSTSTRGPCWLATSSIVSAWTSSSRSPSSWATTTRTPGCGPSSGRSSSRARTKRHRSSASTGATRRTTRRWKSRPRSGGPSASRTSSASSTTSPRRGRASSCSRMTAGRSSWRSPTTSRTSPRSTRAATRRWTGRGPIPRTSWITSARSPRSSRAATGRTCSSTSWTSSTRRVVRRVELVHEVELQVLPVAARDDLGLLAEVIQDVRGMGPRPVHRRVAALVLRGDVGHVVGERHELLAAVVRLQDDALPRLGDVVLEADDVLEAECPPDLGRDLQRLVVRRVAPVEADERCRFVLAREELRPDEGPHPGVRVVVAHEDGDLELDVHAETMEEVASQHGPRVDVEDLAHAVFGVVVEELVEPLQRVVVGLAAPAEIAGDRGRADEVDVRAVGALRVQRLHVAGADDVHGRRDRRQVAVGLLLLHPADLDPAGRHERTLRDRLPRGRDDPREILERAHLQRHRHVVAEGRGVRPVAQDAPAKVGDADERPTVALCGEPVQVGEILGVGGPDALQQGRQLACRPGLAIDLLRGSVAGDDGQHVVDDPRARVEQERVEVIESSGRDGELPAEVGGHLALQPGHPSSLTSSSYSSSFMPNQFSGWGKVRPVTSST